MAKKTFFPTMQASQLPSRWRAAALGATAVLALSACSPYVGVGVPVGPFSVGVGVGSGGVSAGVGTGVGPVGVGVGVNQSGQVTGNTGGLQRRARQGFDLQLAPIAPLLAQHACKAVRIGRRGEGGRRRPRRGHRHGVVRPGGFASRCRACPACAERHASARRGCARIACARRGWRGRCAVARRQWSVCARLQIPQCLLMRDCS